MLTAILFMTFNCVGYVLAIFINPFWGLLVYANVYFNAAEPQLNWWASYLPFTRWNLLTSVVVFISLFLHRDKMSSTKLNNVIWAIAFLCLSTLITFTIAVNQDASHYNYLLLSYCITMVLLIKGIKEFNQFRWICFIIIIYATKLSVTAYLYGKRIHSRLEYHGTADASGSNEFGLLLAAIIPLLLPYIFKGKWYEKMVAILSLPFLLNAFILCNSRSAMVALGASVMICVIFFADKRMRKILLICFVFAVPLFIRLVDPAFIQRAQSLIFSEETLTNQEQSNEVSSGRTEIWRYGTKMIKDYPFGAGPNGFKSLARFYLPDEILTYKNGEDYGQRSAHNTYLQVLIEQGPLGLLIFLLMCGHVILLLIRIKKFANDNISPILKYHALALSISFISILFGGLFNSRIYYEFFWWQVALCVVLYSLITNNNEKVTNV
jgi:putative inorganic carbon (hco3(-)) transporter